MALLDAYGRPINFDALREEQAAPTFSGIRNIYSSIDTSIGLTPQKIVDVLRQAEFGDPWLYLELAERMEEKDELYQGVLHTRKMAVSQLEVAIVPASAAAADIADAQFVEDVLFAGALDLHQSIFDMLDALGKGFSATEIIWDMAGRDTTSGEPRWIPVALKWRDPRWFVFDWVSGERLLLRSFRQNRFGFLVQPTRVPAKTAPALATGEKPEPSSAADYSSLQPATEPLTPYKFITHIAKAKAGLPVRGGLARVAMWNYLFRNYILKDFVTFCEVFAQPLRLGKYNADATEQDKSLLLQAVANIGTDAAAIIPDSMAIQFEQAARTGDSSRVYRDALEYLDRRLTIAILGQELTTALPAGAGSRAAAEVHDVVRRDIATDDARRLAATLNRDLIRPLVELNRGPRRHFPRIKFAFEGREELEQLASALGAFIDRGLPVSQRAILDKFGLRTPAGGEAVLRPLAHGAAPASHESQPDSTCKPIPDA